MWQLQVLETLNVLSLKWLLSRGFFFGVFSFGFSGLRNAEIGRVFLQNAFITVQLISNDTRLV
jgi:hypothetical protein